MKPKLIIITGPTGSGKTELAIKLAKKFHGEIISADSRQIYKGMVIGTAAPCVVAGLPLVDNAVLTHNAGASRDAAHPLQSSSSASGGGGKVGEEQRSPTLSRSSVVSGGHSVFPVRATAIKYKGVRHYLIGFLPPDKIFSVAEFKQYATEIIKDIIFRGKVPIICGGTAHYLQAITEGLSIPRVPPNWELRKKLEKKDLKELVKQLKKLAGKNISDIGEKKQVGLVDLKNKRRVIRAIEILSVIPHNYPRISAAMIPRQKEKPLFHILQLGVDIPRQELYKRIDKRVDKMIKSGFIEEAKKLIKYIRNIRAHSSLDPFVPNGTDPGPFDSSLSGIGYKEVVDYLKGKTTLEEAAQLIKFRTHKYVRYQMNWFRKNKKIYWVRNCQEAEKKIKKFL